MKLDIAADHPKGVHCRQGQTYGVRGEEEMFRKWLHDHLGLFHAYQAKSVTDKFAHEGQLWLKITDYQWCSLCEQSSPRPMNVEWRKMGPLSEYPLHVSD
jgi:hypothetical protein